jgi:hypothetical protein
MPACILAALDSAQDCLDYALRSLSVESPFEACTPDLPTDLRDAVRATVSLGAGAAEWRLTQLFKLRQISDELLPLSSWVNSRRPEHVAWCGGPDAHPAFAAAVCEAMGWPDEALAADVWLHGLAIVGSRPDAGLWRRRSAEE